MRNIFHKFYRTNIGAKVKLETLSSTSNERNTMQLPNFDDSSYNVAEAELLSAFEVFERIEEHVLDKSLLFEVYSR